MLYLCTSQPHLITTFQPILRMTSHYLANASTNTTYHTSFSAMSKRIEPGPPASLFGPPLLSNTKAEAFSSASRKRRPESNPAMFTNQIPDERQGMASSSTQSPTAKKSRTNTPWTAAEEQRLRQMRDAGNSWADIAKVRGTSNFWGWGIPSDRKRPFPAGPKAVLKNIGTRYVFASSRGGATLFKLTCGRICIMQNSRKMRYLLSMVDKHTQHD